MKKELMTMISDLESKDDGLVLQRIQELGNSEDRRVIPYLFELLKKEQFGNKRDQLALALGHLHADQVVPYLLELAKEPENRNKRGSLLYALIDLDCKNHFDDIIDFICTGGYEVACHSIQILKNQFIDDLLSLEKKSALAKVRRALKSELANGEDIGDRFRKSNMLRHVIKILK